MKISCIASENFGKSFSSYIICSVVYSQPWWKVLWPTWTENSVGLHGFLDHTELLEYTIVLTVESWGILKSLAGLACKQCETSDRRPYQKISVCPTPKIHVNRPIDIFLKRLTCWIIIYSNIKRWYSYQQL